ncbi:MAG: homocysteine S-methyltransferase [Anaerolineales bacterium]|nr:homocysteine S-methyltransferase [Anaerolineales bacterium]
MQNLLTPFLTYQGTIILDGGLATELEKRGYDLNDPLWSAKILLEQPEAIYWVHWDYLKAGADVLITASYQATVAGFMARGLEEAAAVDLLLSSIRIATKARDDFWAVEAHRHNRLRPLVAASIGPYGAYLANGAEYTGDYDLDEAGLVDFHRRRWHLLANSGADLLACETIPSLSEARAYVQLLAETPDTAAWFCFSCRDGRHISDGTLLADCGRYLEPLPQVAAMGINCTAPRFVPELITQLQSVTHKPIVVYPNSGESYDPVQKCWLGESVPEEYGTSGREWRKLGAAAIGGCCRTRPSHILALSTRLKRVKKEGTEGD